MFYKTRFKLWLHKIGVIDVEGSISGQPLEPMINEVAELCKKQNVPPSIGALKMTVEFILDNLVTNRIAHLQGFLDPESVQVIDKKLDHHIARLRAQFGNTPGRAFDKWVVDIVNAALQADEFKQAHKEAAENGRDLVKMPPVIEEIFEAYENHRQEVAV